MKATEEGKARHNYQGASQDEVTFLEMAKEAGFAYFVERSSETLTIEV